MSREHSNFNQVEYFCGKVCVQTHAYSACLRYEVCSKFVGSVACYTNDSLQEMDCPMEEFLAWTCFLPAARTTATSPGI